MDRPPLQHSLRFRRRLALRSGLACVVLLGATWLAPACGSESGGSSNRGDPLSGGQDPRPGEGSGGNGGAATSVSTLSNGGTSNGGASERAIEADADVTTPEDGGSTGPLTPGDAGPVPLPTECPPPEEPQGTGGCIATEIYAHYPGTDLCCYYSNRCAAPDGWDMYFSEAECKSSSGLTWYASCGSAECDSGDALYDDPDLENCTTQQLGEHCAHAGLVCDGVLPCDAYLVCEGSDPRAEADNCAP